MAHFAKLDENNIVLEVHVVNNDALDSSNEEASGIEFLTQWSGGHTLWKQCSYNGTFRGAYPGPGWRYDAGLDKFISPARFPSWTLNAETGEWMPPIERPEGSYYWNEADQTWVSMD